MFAAALCAFYDDDDDDDDGLNILDWILNWLIDCLLFIWIDNLIKENWIRIEEKNGRSIEKDSVQTRYATAGRLQRNHLQTIAQLFAQM